eukprot:GFUD01135498.1.p1 GENE.GFUD01135498.1~~GFUD01135498.1.p1  ORF type:complete len:616 (+),score=152.19 GFUD01135498.1:39-1850(+)
MLVDVKDNGFVATEDLSKDTLLFKIPGKRTEFNFENFYGFGEKREVGKKLAVKDEKIGFVILEPNEDESVLKNLQEKPPKFFLAFPESSFKLFSEFHKLLKEYDNKNKNAKIVVKVVNKEPELWVASSEDIKCGSEILVKFGKDYWMRKLLYKTVNPLEKLVLLIFLEAFNNPDNLPEKFRTFEHFFIKWRVWSQADCASFLQDILKVSVIGDFVQSIHCLGFAPRTIIYRMLQKVGALNPPNGSGYKNYPEALRTLAHQSRDLCFWPVQIGDNSDQTESMRKKMQDGHEFGPNATWKNYPKTKQVFMAAKSDNLAILQEVYDTTINLNAYGTCKLWTPLHVACFYGSQKVVKFFLSKKVIFNSKDRNGKTPLNLAEENGHTNLAKLLVAHAANESVLPDHCTEIRNLPSSDDPKLTSLEATINCKNVGNTAYKNKNYKSAFKFYSRGIDLCPANHAEMVILYSNRAQVLITAKAFNLALRDVNRALDIDPVHEKTILRRAHCYEESNPEKSLTDLDLLMYISVPDRLVNDRRNHLFLQTIVRTTKEATVEKKLEDLVIEDSVDIQGVKHSLDNIPMSALMDLSLEDLRNLDGKVGRYDGNDV